MGNCMNLSVWLRRSGFVFGILLAMVAGVAADLSASGVRVLAIQGRVETQRAGAGAWERAQTNTILMPKDRLRTGPRSRATLQLSNRSVQRLDELSSIEIQPDAGSNSVQMEIQGGGLYFFNREKPVEQKFKTPVASGAILGTEFAVRVAPNGDTRVSLLEGRIDLTGDGGGTTLAPGEEALVTRGSVPQKTARLDAVGAVQWCLYYPAVLDPAELALDPLATSGLSESLSAYRAGDLPAALAAYPVGRVPSDSAERIYLATLVLASGQVTSAEALLRDAGGESADAVRSLMESVRGRVAAGEFPGEAASPLASTLLAGSYAAQAAGDLETALSRAWSAVQRSPEFGYAWARVAELEFSFGRVTEAQAALDRALALSPRNAAALALRGFILAAQNRVYEAMAAFDAAIAVDGSLANAWLGRGLCQIRCGQVDLGRADLQVAAAIEPTRAVLRSYLGKAWSESRDAARAEKELLRARELDPADPTGWLYAALLEQRNNQINAAVDDLEHAKELNDNRSLYRSGLLLDQDRAMRSANLAGVYRDAGLIERSVREASRAVEDDYGNASAHQFLADSYYALRDPRKFNLRYETPWFSELLVAQLMAPVGAGSLSQYVSQNEYSKLFERDRLGFRSTTEYGSAGNWQQIASQFGTLRNLSYAVDVDYRSENGYFPNTDSRQLSVYGKGKAQFTPADTGFLMVNYNDYESGDTRQYYDPADPRVGVSPGFRSQEVQEPNVFLGWHHEWSPSQHTLLLAGHLNGTLNYSDTNAIIPVLSRPTPSRAETALLTRVFDVNYGRELNAWTAELQHLAQVRTHTLVAGLRYQTGELDTTGSQILHNGRSQFPGPDVFPAVRQSTSTDLQRLSTYLYDTWRIVPALRLTAGVSYDRLDYPQNVDFLPLDPGETDADKVSPKVGLTWSPWADTHLRAAWTRSLGGVFYDTSVRLEPVQVAGFNQAWRSLIPESVSGLTPGSEFETLGVGFDQKFPTRTYLSVAAERLTSEVRQNFGAFDWARNGRLVAQPVTVGRDLDFEERTGSAQVNQLLGQHVALGVSYRVSEAELDTLYPSLVAGIVNDPNARESATLHEVGGTARCFFEGGFFAELGALWLQQSNRGYAVKLPGDDFWQFNVFVGHRFLDRRAELRVGVLNLGDQDYRLNPLNLRAELPRERTFYAGLKLYF